MLEETDILFFVEDPSPANYIAELPQLLESRDIKTEVLATGKATATLKHRNVSFTELNTKERAERLMDRINPRIVVVGTAINPDTFGFDLTESAKFRSVPSVGIIDARMRAENRFKGHSNNPLHHLPDFVLVPDQWTGKAFQRLGVQGERIVLGGHPQYDYVIKRTTLLEEEGREIVRSRLFPETDRSKKIVVFVDEPSGNVAPAAEKQIEYSLSGRSDSSNRMKISLEEFLDAIKEIEERYYLAFKLHPKSNETDYSNYHDEFDFVSKEGDPLEWVFAADLVVGMTSMLLMEAALMRRPTLSIIPRLLEKQWLPSIEAGVTPCVTERGKIPPMLSKLLEQSDGFDKNLLRKKIVNNSAGKIVAFFKDVLEHKVTSTVRYKNPV